MKVILMTFLFLTTFQSIAATRIICARAAGSHSESIHFDKLEDSLNDKIKTLESENKAVEVTSLQIQSSAAAKPGALVTNEVICATIKY